METDLVDDSDHILVSQLWSVRLGMETQHDFTGNRRRRSHSYGQSDWVWKLASAIIAPHLEHTSQLWSVRLGMETIPLGTPRVRQGFCHSYGQSDWVWKPVIVMWAVTEEIVTAMGSVRLGMETTGIPPTPCGLWSQLWSVRLGMETYRPTSEPDCTRHSYGQSDWVWKRESLSERVKHENRHSYGQSDWVWKPCKQSDMQRPSSLSQLWSVRLGMETILSYLFDYQTPSQLWSVRLGMETQRLGRFDNRVVKSQLWSVRLGMETRRPAQLRTAVERAGSQLWSVRLGMETHTPRSGGIRIRSQLWSVRLGMETFVALEAAVVHRSHSCGQSDWVWKLG